MYHFFKIKDKETYSFLNHTLSIPPSPPKKQPPTKQTNKTKNSKMHITNSNHWVLVAEVQSKNVLEKSIFKFVAVIKDKIAFSS